jgi:hypothetical protein
MRDARNVNEVEMKEFAQTTVFDLLYGSWQVLDLVSEKWMACVL